MFLWMNVFTLSVRLACNSLRHERLLGIRYWFTSNYIPFRLSASRGLEAKTHEAEAKTHEAEAEATTHEAEAEARFFGLEAEARPRGLTSLLLCISVIVLCDGSTTKLSQTKRSMTYGSQKMVHDKWFTNSNPNPQHKP